MKQVNKPIRIPTMIRATTVKVPATADLFAQKPVEAAPKFCSTVSVGPTAASESVALVVVDNPATVKETVLVVDV